MTSDGRARRNGFGIFYRNQIDYSVIVEQGLKRIKKKKKKRKGGVREIWNMSTEMQIFVRKLITRINSSQNVQTVCQTGRFYLFSRRQTELCTDIGRLRQMRDACACTCACTCTHPRMHPRITTIRYKIHALLWYTIRTTDCTRIL